MAAAVAATAFSTVPGAVLVSKLDPFAAKRAVIDAVLPPGWSFDLDDDGDAFYEDSSGNSTWEAPPEVVNALASFNK